MPLKKGSSRKTVSSNIREFKKGPRNKATAKKSGKAVAQKQAVAVALKEARKSGKKGAKKKTSVAAAPRNLERKGGSKPKPVKKKAADRAVRNKGRR